VRGPRRLAVLQKRWGNQLQDIVRNLIDVSKLKDNIQPEEASQHSIDFITAYYLVDTNKLDAYAKVRRSKH
jgi:2-methylcitrate dehydratase PrpD